MSLLYRPEILALNDAPLNQGLASGETHSARCSHPLCGDRVDVSLRVEAGRVEEVRANTRGCAVARASASLMTVDLRGQTVEAALQRPAELEAWLRSAAPQPPSEAQLELLSAAGDHRSRWGCVLLGWQAAAKALLNRD